MRARIWGAHERIVFRCPGCEKGEFPQLADHVINPKVHQFNGNLERPTFSPSLLMTYDYGEDHRRYVCHSFVRDGCIQFLDDCTHPLKGQTIELPHIADEEGDNV